MYFVLRATLISLAVSSLQVDLNELLQASEVLLQVEAQDPVYKTVETQSVLKCGEASDRSPLFGLKAKVDSGYVCCADKETWVEDASKCPVGGGDTGCSTDPTDEDASCACLLAGMPNEKTEEACINDPASRTKSQKQALMVEGVDPLAVTPERGVGATYNRENDEKIHKITIACREDKLRKLLETKIFEKGCNTCAGTQNTSVMCARCEEARDKFRGATRPGHTGGNPTNGFYAPHNPGSVCAKCVERSFRCYWSNGNQVKRETWEDGSKAKSLSAVDIACYEELEEGPFKEYKVESMKPTPSDARQKEIGKRMHTQLSEGLGAWLDDKSGSSCQALLGSIQARFKSKKG